MPFVNIDFTKEQAKEVAEQLEKKELPEGIMVLTDGTRETVHEALKSIEKAKIPVTTEDLLIRAIEGKLIGNAIVW